MGAPTFSLAAALWVSKDRDSASTLQCSIQTFGADQGLLVCWGGFKKSLVQEARQSFFSVRLWSASEVVEALYG
jgi:restriction system protein